MKVAASSLLAFIALSVSAMVATADVVYLEAAFNDKTIGAPIGTGGPAVGEPVVVSTTITAIVTESPMLSPSLQIADNSETTAGSARFEFLESAEITTGTVVVAADLWFEEISEGSYYYLYVRERSGSSAKFASLVFEPDGLVYLGDAAGGHGSIGSYEAGSLYRIIINFDMDAETYDVYLDGSLVRDDQPHSVVGDYGVGAVLVGCREDADLDGTFNIDALTVTDTMQPTSTEEATWGRIKGGYHR